MEPIIILQKIIDKGGIMGTFGRLYIKDNFMAGKYIIECSKHLHPDSCLFDLWGKRLSNEIISYSEKKKMHKRIDKISKHEI